MWTKVQKPRTTLSATFDVAFVGNGFIAQQIATVAGQDYTITFDYTQDSGDIQVVHMTHGTSQATQFDIGTVLPDPGPATDSFTAESDNEFIFLYGAGTPGPDNSWVGNVTNVSVTLDGGGPELVTNGGFIGSATGWILGEGWAYAGNKVQFTAQTPGKLVFLDSVIPPASGFVAGDVLTFSNNGNGQGKVKILEVDGLGFPDEWSISAQGENYPANGVYTAFLSGIGEWTDVPKPTDPIITIGDGTPWGMLMAITMPISSSVMSGWTRVLKPALDNWNKVDKPIN